MERKHITGHKKRWAIDRFKRALARAKRMKAEFTLTLDDIPTPDICPISGILLDYPGAYFPRRTGWMTGSGDIIYGLHSSTPVLARIDYNRGFTPDNIFTISHQAHLMRRAR